MGAYKDDSYRRSLKIKAKAESIMRETRDEILKIQADKMKIPSNKKDFIMPEGIRT
jgi:hypothetical protein